MEHREHKLSMAPSAGGPNLALADASHRGWFHNFYAWGSVKVAALLALGLIPLGCSVQTASSLQTEKAETVIVRVADGVGSGVVLGPYTVLTAAHVTDQATAEIETVDGQKLQAKVTFIWTKGDFALLHTVDAIHEPAARIALRAPIEGEPIVAIGDALDQVPWFIARGTIASTRPPKESSQFSDDLVSADLTLVPGMSGGPVFDAQGEVLGLSDAVMPFRLGITHVSFIVPAEALWRELKSIPPFNPATGY